MTDTPAVRERDVSTSGLSLTASCAGHVPTGCTTIDVTPTVSRSSAASKPDGATVATICAFPLRSAVTTARAVSVPPAAATWRIEGSLLVQVTARRSSRLPPRTRTAMRCVSVTVRLAGRGRTATGPTLIPWLVTLVRNAVAAKPTGATVAMTSAVPLRSAVTWALPESAPAWVTVVTWRMEGSLVLQVTARPGSGWPRAPRTRTPPRTVSVTLRVDRSAESARARRSGWTLTGTCSSPASKPGGPPSTTISVVPGSRAVTTACCLASNESTRVVGCGGSIAATDRMEGSPARHTISLFVTSAPPNARWTTAASVSTSVTVSVSGQVVPDGSTLSGATVIDLWSCTGAKPGRVTAAWMVVVPLAMAVTTTCSWAASESAPLPDVGGTRASARTASLLELQSSARPVMGRPEASVTVTDSVSASVTPSCVGQAGAAAIVTVRSGGLAKSWAQPSTRTPMRATRSG